jgi:hypothetical protein
VPQCVKVSSMAKPWLTSGSESDQFTLCACVPEQFLIYVICNEMHWHLWLVISILESMQVLLACMSQHGPFTHAKPASHEPD